MIAANNGGPISKGPSLGNVEPPDSYLRLKQNIDALYKSMGNVAALTAPQPPTADQLGIIQSSLQAGGSHPLDLTALPPGYVGTINGLGGAVNIVAANNSGLVLQVVGQNINISLPHVGPGAATYTTGLKLTVGGNNGTITLDAFGRVTAVTQAS
jgi:hypothetical protein